MRKLSFEEMENVKGGDSCPGVQDAFELLEVVLWLERHGYGAQASAITGGFWAGTLQYSPAC